MCNVYNFIIMKYGQKYGGIYEIENMSYIEKGGLD